jgi:diaminohydroxyphosphoribosylaminopyrimidine deaminase/5-amino-6-(5-phosphoribosylamino)uracil reductase
VGTNTVLEDNPKLNVRYWKGKNPVRIVLDRELKISSGFNVFDKSSPTIVLTEVSDASLYLKDITYELIDFQKDVAAQICEKLYQHKINSVIVEGGSQTLQTFIDAGLWDEARVLTGTTSFSQGLKAPVLKGNLVTTKKLGQDILKIYTP